MCTMMTSKCFFQGVKTRPKGNVNYNKHFQHVFFISSEDWKLVRGPFIIILTSKYDEICLYIVVDLVAISVHPLTRMKTFKPFIIGY